VRDVNRKQMAREKVARNRVPVLSLDKFSKSMLQEVQDALGGVEVREMSRGTMTSQLQESRTYLVNTPEGEYLLQTGMTENGYRFSLLKPVEDLEAWGDIGSEPETAIASGVDVRISYRLGKVNGQREISLKGGYDPLVERMWMKSQELLD